MRSKEWLMRVKMIRELRETANPQRTNKVADNHFCD